jgi:hypothetical protein
MPRLRPKSCGDATCREWSRPGAQLFWFQVARYPFIESAKVNRELEKEQIKTHLPKREKFRSTGPL